MGGATRLIRTLIGLLSGTMLAACGAGPDTLPGPEQAQASLILDAAQRVMGVWPTPQQVQLVSDAAVDGPAGNFRTLVHSSSDGRVRMEQPHSGFLAGVGRSGGIPLNLGGDEEGA